VYRYNLQSFGFIVVTVLHGVVHKLNLASFVQ